VSCFGQYNQGERCWCRKVTAKHYCRSWRTGITLSAWTAEPVLTSRSWNATCVALDFGLWWTGFVELKHSMTGLVFLFTWDVKQRHLHSREDWKSGPDSHLADLAFLNFGRTENADGFPVLISGFLQQALSTPWHMSPSMFLLIPIFLLLTILHPYEVREGCGDQNVPHLVFPSKDTNWDSLFV